MNPTVAALSEELDVLSCLAVSFKLCPPRVPELGAQLWSEIKRLEPLESRFVSVTCGAGGSTQHRTKAIVECNHTETELAPAAHLTCIGATRQQVDEVARGYWQAGVRHIVALRGDPPGGVERYCPSPDGYAYAADLTTAVCRILKTPVLDTAGCPAVTGRA
jgi:methylenetetrahydrofolate reductase (NADPH)